MSALEKHRTTIATSAWWMAWAALVIGQLHALSRFATEDGKGDLELPLTRAWAVPAADALSPLLTWSHPVEVYLTYGKLWTPIFAAFTLCALLVYRRRQPRGFETWAWRVALLGYVSATVGVFATYWTQWGSEFNWFLTIAFGITVLALLITLIGSTMLGISLLRNGFGPLTPAWLLTLVIPLALGITQVTSLGNAVLPVVFAFAILGRRIAREGAPEFPARVTEASAQGV